MLISVKLAYKCQMNRVFNWVTPSPPHPLESPEEGTLRTGHRTSRSHAIHSATAIHSANLSTWIIIKIRITCNPSQLHSTSHMTTRHAYTFDVNFPFFGLVLLQRFLCNFIFFWMGFWFLCGDIRTDKHLDKRFYNVYIYVTKTLAVTWYEPIRTGSAILCTIYTSVPPPSQP